MLPRLNDAKVRKFISKVVFLYHQRLFDRKIKPLKSKKLKKRKNKKTKQNKGKRRTEHTYPVSGLSVSKILKMYLNGCRRR